MLNKEWMEPKNQKQSNNRLLFLIIIALVVIFLAGIGGVVGIAYFLSHKPNPEPTPTPQDTQAQDEADVRFVLSRFLESMNMNVGFNRSEFLATTTTEYQNTGFARALLGGTELNYGSSQIISVYRVSDTQYDCRISITTIASEMSGPSQTIMANVEVIKEGDSWLVNKMS